MQFKPFKAILMNQNNVKDCSCVPYDVIESPEATIIVNNNPFNFLVVTHSEVFHPNLSCTNEAVYKEGLMQLEKLIEKNILYNTDTSAFYVYKQDYKDQTQIGIVGLTSINDYENNKIKKHELTRVDKEKDRINHFYNCKANTEPIFLFHKDNATIEALTSQITINSKPIIDFVDELQVSHRLYLVCDNALINVIENEFNKMNSVYIADGHHRCASAYKVGQKFKSENPNHTGNEAYNFNLSVIFPQSQLKILPYNRLITNLNGKTQEEIFKQIKINFVVTRLSDFKLPNKPHELVIFLKGEYYKLNLKNPIQDTNPVNNLDVSIVQSLILEPIFNIKDPRTSDDIQFYGGNSLEKEVTALSNNVLGVFMYPTRIEDIINVSNNNKTMPPKSTWFEPKLRSGLFLYKF